MCWLLTDFAVLSLAAAAIGRLPLPAAIPVSGLAGVANARAWFGLVRAATRKAAAASGRRGGRAGRCSGWPLAPLAAVLSIALVIGMTRLAFVVGRGPRQVGEAAAIPGRARPAAAARAAAAGTAPRPGHGAGARAPGTSVIRSWSSWASGRPAAAGPGRSSRSRPARTCSSSPTAG